MLPRKNANVPVPQPVYLISQDRTVSSAVPRSPPCAVDMPLFEKRFPQVASSWRDQRMKLCKEGDGPEEVAADNGEDERGPPEHLVFSFGREEPRRGAHGDDDGKANEDGVPLRHLSDIISSSEQSLVLLR